MLLVGSCATAPWGDYMSRMPWHYIEPGDIGFDGGRGIFGWLIRRATGAYGHTWVYHEFLGTNERGVQEWRTIEAGPRGIRWQVRDRPPVKVARLWRTKAQQRGILKESEACLGAKYGWGEIVRLALHTVGLRVDGWADNPDRMICSNHVARSVTRGLGCLQQTLPYPPNHIWPQRLAEWCDWVLWTQERNKDKRSKG
jgi:hypothetical protein